MHRAHIKILFQFIICNITCQGCRKRFINIVVDLCMVVSIDCRVQKYEEYDQPYFVMFGDKTGSFVHVRKQSLVFCLLDCLVEYEDHCRKNSYTADNSDHNTLRHNDTHITSQGKGHNTQCKETGDRSNGTSRYGFEGICDRMCHRTFFLIIFLLICFKRVQQENGIVHCNTKLKYRRQ